MYGEDEEKQHLRKEMRDSTSFEDPLLEDFRPQRRDVAASGTSWRRCLPWFLHSLLVSISGMFFLSGLYHRSGQCPDTYFPIVGEHAPIHRVRFNGTFDRSSPYKGPPNDMVDEAWESIAPLGVMSISEDIYQTLNASKNAVKVPPQAGGGYMAVFEGIHLIHCVKVLWMQTYPSYYTAQYNLSQTNPIEWHEHLDHCADMLRQKLMCDADPNLITYNWIRNHYAPKPNFNVQHQCRDYSRLLDVAAKQKVDGSGFAHGWILRPTDRPVVEFGEPPFDPEADT